MPLEEELLSQARVNRISRNKTRPSLILGIANRDSGINIQNRWFSTRTVRCARNIEGIAKSVFLSTDRTGEITVRGGLLNLALKVVERVLSGRHTLVELVVPAIIDVCDGE